MKKFVTQPLSSIAEHRQSLGEASQQPHNQMSLVQMEKFILKLNAHAIEFIRSKDAGRQEMAREFLLRAESTLVN